MADTLTIKSNDGQEFTLPKDQYEQSEYLKEQAGIGSEDAVEIFSMDATGSCFAPVPPRQVSPPGFCIAQSTLRRPSRAAVLTKVVDFFTKNKENPIPVAEIEHPDPFGPQGEGKAKLIPKVCTATSGASGFNSARPVPCPAQPLSSPNLAEHNFPAWSVEWVDSLSRDDLFAYARVSSCQRTGLLRRHSTFEPALRHTRCRPRRRLLPRVKAHGNRLLHCFPSFLCSTPRS